MLAAPLAECSLMLVSAPKSAYLWAMKLRLDLLEHLTAEDIREEAEATERSAALIARVIKRSQQNGAKGKPKPAR